MHPPARQPSAMTVRRAPVIDLRRIKHLTVIGDDRDAISARFRAVFDAGAPHAGVMERFGLINDHFPLGDSFVEVLQPVDQEKAGGKYLARFGAGFYMLIFEIRDQPRALAHLTAMGARVSMHSERPEYRNIHLHPSTNLGPLLGLGDPVGPNPWWPGGPDWQQQANSNVARLLREVALVTDDLDRMAGRYRRYFGITPERFERLLDGSLSAWASIGDGETVLQYIQPNGTESAAGAHLAAHGPGIFEARLQVNDLTVALARALAAGVAAQPEQRRGNARTALLEPATMFGQRWLVVEQAGDYPRLGL
jgi:hypothetical protein